MLMLTMHALKWLKCSHNVHLGTMCHLCWQIEECGHLHFPMALKNKLGRGRWDLVSCHVSLNSVQLFLRRSRKCSRQSEAGTGRPSWISDRSVKLKLDRGRWDLASYKISLKSIQRFQRRSRKCEMWKVNDGRRTDDGQRVISIAHLSLQLRYTKKHVASGIVARFVPLIYCSRKMLCTLNTKIWSSC